MTVVTQILRDRQSEVQSRRLKHDSHQAPDVSRMLDDVEAEHANGSSAGCGKRRHNPKERRLSAAVRTEQTENFAARYDKAHAGERVSRTIRVVEVMNVEGGIEVVQSPPRSAIINPQSRGR